MSPRIACSWRCWRGRESRRQPSSSTANASGSSIASSAWRRWPRRSTSPMPFGQARSPEIGRPQPPRRRPARWRRDRPDDASVGEAGESSLPPPLVGRDSEYAALMAAVAGVGPAGRLLVIEGEPGIGKTRLATAVAEATRAGGGEVLEARGYAGESAIPLSAIAELVRAGLGRPRRGRSTCGRRPGVAGRRGAAPPDPGRDRSRSLARRRSVRPDPALRRPRGRPGRPRSRASARAAVGRRPSAGRCLDARVPRLRRPPPDRSSARAAARLARRGPRAGIARATPHRRGWLIDPRQPRSARPAGGRDPRRGGPRQPAERGPDRRPVRGFRGASALRRRGPGGTGLPVHHDPWWRPGAPAGQDLVRQRGRPADPRRRGGHRPVIRPEPRATDQWPERRGDGRGPGGAHAARLRPGGRHRRGRRAAPRLHACEPSRCRLREPEHGPAPTAPCPGRGCALGLGTHRPGQGPVVAHRVPRDPGRPVRGSRGGASPRRRRGAVGLRQRGSARAPGGGPGARPPGGRGPPHLARRGPDAPRRLRGGPVPPRIRGGAGRAGAGGGNRVPQGAAPRPTR